MSLLVELPERSGGRVRGYPQPASLSLGNGFLGAKNIENIRFMYLKCKKNALKTRKYF
jgi:hypothetical protein